MIGIYSIVNSITKKQYIGSSTNIPRRFQDHMTTLKIGKHHNKDLQTEFNRFGIQDFGFYIKEFCDKSELREREQHYLDTIPWNTLYNIARSSSVGQIDRRTIPVYLLDLAGNVVDKYSSISELLRKFGARQKTYKINTKSVFMRRYRIVSPEFYEYNFEEIKSWKSYTNKAARKRELVNRAKYFLEKDGQYSTYVHRTSLSFQIGLSTSYTGRLLEEADPCTRNGTLFGTIKNQPEYLNLKYGSN